MATLLTPQAANAPASADPVVKAPDQEAPSRGSRQGVPPASAVDGLPASFTEPVGQVGYAVLFGLLVAVAAFQLMRSVGLAGAGRAGRMLASRVIELPSVRRRGSSHRTARRRTPVPPVVPVPPPTHDVDDETPEEAAPADSGSSVDKDAHESGDRRGTLAVAGTRVLGRLLGSTGIFANGKPVKLGRTDAIRLVGLLALHPKGLTREAIFSRLWPDADPRQDRHRLDTAVSHISTALRDATGKKYANFIQNVRGVRSFDENLITFDVWEFRRRTSIAATASTDTERAAMLQEAIGDVAGELLPDEEQIWVEEFRENTRLEVLKAVTRLAKIEARHNPDQAIDTVVKAIERINPYDEGLWRLRMSLEAELIGPDIARGSYDLLATLLAELNQKPDPETRRLLDKLTRGAA